MALALSFGALLLGTIADRMRRRGIALQALLAAVAMLFIAAQLTLICGCLCRLICLGQSWRQSERGLFSATRSSPIISPKSLPGARTLH